MMFRRLTSWRPMRTTPAFKRAIPGIPRRSGVGRASWFPAVAGDLDPGTGGLRKVRMTDPTRGKGKRGGARVHYLWLPHRERIYLLFAYSKDEDDTLSQQQKKVLRAVVEGIKKESSA